MIPCVLKKRCNTCKDDKELSEFHNKKSNRDGLDYDCKICANKKIRDRRSRNGNINTKNYEKTFHGKLVRTYRNMMSRVKGILKKKAHLYKGLEILSKEDFYNWSNNDSEYARLFMEWVDSEYEQRLSPSIDRKNPLLGYVLDNMRWLTHSENSRISNNNGSRN